MAMTRKDFIKKSSAVAATTGISGCMTATAGANKLALFGGAPVMGKEFAKKNADKRLSRFYVTLEFPGQGKFVFGCQ
jgi:hypothetical protein